MTAASAPPTMPPNAPPGRWPSGDAIGRSPDPMPAVGATMYTLIETCEVNDVAPRAWPADVLATARKFRASPNCCSGTGSAYKAPLKPRDLLVGSSVALRRVGNAVVVM